MAQGWNVNTVADNITFDEDMGTGAAVVVKSYASAGYNATDLWAFSSWNPGWGYPGEVEFYSDRLVWANSKAQPQTLWMSKAGDYRNHGRNVPSEDADGITMTINARQVNPIRELIPMDKLIVMTASAEILLTTGADEIVAPGKVGFAFQSYYGSSRLPAQVVGDYTLFVQGRGFVLRDLGFQFTKDGYSGNDLSVYASHLLEGFTIVDMAFQQVPYNALWMVRSDGALITVTYLREQEVVGWALHTVSGQVKTVCTIPYGNENAVYFGVWREVNGQTVAYIERLAQRTIADIREAFFVDSGLTFDGRNQPGTQTLTANAPGVWSEDGNFTLTGSLPFWVGASDVGDQVRLFSGTEHLDLVITGYTDATHVTMQSVGDVPLAFQGVAITQWDIYRTTISGAGHLEGLTVAVLGDGSVESRKPVVGGSFELDEPRCVVNFGLPIRAIGETLDMNAPGTETIRNRYKLIPEVCVIVKDTRGLRAGPDEARLEDVKTEWDENDEIIPALSGLLEYNISQDWSKESRVLFVQDDPLPATVLGIIPKVEVGG